MRSLLWLRQLLPASDQRMRNSSYAARFIWGQGIVDHAKTVTSSHLADRESEDGLPLICGDIV